MDMYSEGIQNHARSLEKLVWRGDWGFILRKFFFKGHGLKMDNYPHEYKKKSRLGYAYCSCPKLDCIYRGHTIGIKDK